MAIAIADDRRKGFSGPGLIGIAQERLEKLGNATTAMRARPPDRLTFQEAVGLCHVIGQGERMHHFFIGWQGMGNVTQAQKDKAVQQHGHDGR